MKTIKIIRGTFGLHVNGSVRPKTPADPPFEVEDAIAARLVIKKVAEYSAKAAPAVASPPAGDGPRAYDDTMKLDVLKDIATKDYGVPVETVAGLRAKTAVVAAIDAHRAAGNQTREDGEQQGDGEGGQEPGNNEPPPNLEAQDPV